MTAGPALVGRFLPLLAGVACSVAAGEIAAPPTFERDVLPILTARGCNQGACHGKSGGQNGFALSLLGFDPDGDHHALVVQGRGRRIFDASPASSLLLAKATAAMPHGGGRRLEPDGDDAKLLLRWIEAGAPRTPADAPRLSHITIAPEPRSLAPGESVWLTVTAHETDGSSRDVTAITAFFSNEPAVAGAAADGTITAGRLPGEASIMARFMGRIVTWDTSVPRPGRVDPAAWNSVPTRNFVDDLAWRKLRAINVLPSATADDATFLRRASLDAIGRLPTVDQARRFLADTGPAKRERLVDELLTRPEYADRWANLWADLLRPNPYRVGIKATLSLDTFLRDAFAANMPYDRFVAELLTATGSVWRNGAAVIYRDRRSPDEIVTLASQLFLGVRLECAKCHQHPFEVYGQGDFYGLAAYFARVGYRGDGISPPISGREESVVVTPDGEVRHPLTDAVLPPKPLGGEPAAAIDGDRRAALVAWLRGADHPTFAAAAVNRIWAEFFGLGLVDPVDDLRATNPPSNPELLAALAAEFRSSGFDQKRLIATIMKSHLYGLSSLPNETNSGDLRNFSRHYRRRLRAEVVADAIDDATGLPSAYPGMPAGAGAAQLWTHRSAATLLDVFGRPDPNQDPPCERLGDATVVQALHLMNGSHMHAKVTADAGLPARLVAGGKEPAEIVEELYLATYSRFPSAAERQAAAAEFARPGAVPRTVAEDLLWALVNTPEFIYSN